MSQVLKPKHQKFVDAYIATNGNATKAAQMAGYGNGDEYSRLAGHRLITNDNILRAVKGASEANGLSIDRIMTRLSHIIEKGRDSDSIQAIKVWGDLTGAFAPKAFRLLDQLSDVPKTPKEIDSILEKMRNNSGVES